MEFYDGIYLFFGIALRTLVRILQGRSSRLRTIFRNRIGNVAAAGIVLVFGGLLAGCGSSPSIGLLNVTPGDGTLFVGAAGAAGAHFQHSSFKSSKRPQVARPEDFASATCGTLQYTAMVTYADGTVKDMTSQVTWNSSNTSAATIDNNGNATGVAMGITYIQGNLGKVSTGSSPLYVDQLNSLQLSPPNATLPIGVPTAPTTLQFSVVGAFTQPDGSSSTRDITSLVTWSSSNPNVATIQPTGGLATSFSQGTTTIDASVCGVSNTTQLTVGPPAPASLQITPTTPTLAVGTSLPFSAIELYTDGTTHSLTGTLQWSSSSKNSIVSGFTGVTFGVSPGIATIAATEFGGNGLTGTTDVTVQAAVAKFAYVANSRGNGTGSISSFTVDALAGTLTPLASTAAIAPQQVLLSPSGNFLYSIDSSSFVHVYQITPPGAGTPTISAGTLTLLDNANPTPYPPVLAGGGGTNIGAIDPTGQFLYVIDRSANTLYGFQIQQSQTGATPFGSLQPIANGAPFSGANFSFNEPTWVMVDRAGQYLYVVSAGNRIINGYAINFDGTLTPVGSATPLPQTGNGPVYATTDSQGRIFVANSIDNSVSAYLINNDGTWSLSQTLAIAGATQVINVKTDPAGLYLYVLDKGGANGGQVFAYPFIPQVAGNLFGDPIGQPQAVGSSPNGISVDPTGVFLAVDNSGNNNLSLLTIVKGSANNTTPGELLPTTQGTAPTDANPQFVVFYNALPLP
jgi:6-phosphogluconolactonase (cycloisomerase 2 family)